MTNQLQGEILFDGWSGSTAADWVYTPWITVRGDIATFAVQIIQNQGSQLVWQVQGVWI